MNGNGAVAPMDFTATSEDQPINLCDKLPPGTALGTPSYPSDGCGTDGLRSRVKYGVKTTPEVCGAVGPLEPCMSGRCEADMKWLCARSRDAKSACRPWPPCRAFCGGSGMRSHSVTSG